MVPAELQNIYQPITANCGISAGLVRDFEKYKIRVSDTNIDKKGIASCYLSLCDLTQEEIAIVEGQDV